MTDAMKRCPYCSCLVENSYNEIEYVCGLIFVPAKLTTNGWISVDVLLPTFGSRVVLFANNAIQEESFLFEGYQNKLGWYRDELDEGLKVEAGQYWRPWPHEKPKGED